MIDRDVFTEWMDELDAHFPGERSERVIAVYWKALSKRMDTESFEAACVEILGASEFFPPWREFVETQEPTEAEAAEEWELCRRIMAGEDVLDRMTPEGERVVKLLGGPSRLRRTPLDQVRWVRKEFMDRYGSLSGGPEPDELPPMSEEGKQIVGEVAAGMLEPSHD